MSERVVRNEAEVFIQRRLVEVRLQELQRLRQLSGRKPEQTRADEECSAKFLGDALADWEKLIGRAQKEAEEAAEELGRGAERAWQQAKNSAPSRASAVRGRWVERWQERLMHEVLELDLELWRAKVEEEWQRNPLLADAMSEVVAWLLGGEWHSTRVRVPSRFP